MALMLTYSEPVVYSSSECYCILDLYSSVTLVYPVPLPDIYMAIAARPWALQHRGIGMRECWRRGHCRLPLAGQQGEAIILLGGLTLSCQVLFCMSSKGTVCIKHGRCKFAERRGERKRAIVCLFW